MSFYKNVIRKDSRFNSTAIIKDVSLLEPGTRVAVAKLIVLAHEAGHQLVVGETFRSQSRQEKCYRNGSTQLKKVGCHGYGVACDLQLLVNGKYDPNGEHYVFFQQICRKVGLISGIDWGTPAEHHNFHDWDHVQRVPVFRQNELFAGTWYPDINYDPYADQIAHGIK